MIRWTKIKYHRLFVPSLIIVFVILIAVGLTIQSQKITIITFAFAIIPIVIYFAIFKLELLGIITVLLIPLSVKTQIGGSVISFPAEVLVAIIALFYLIYSLSKTNGFSINIWKHPITIFILLDLVWSLISGLLGEMPIITLKRLLMKVLFTIVFYFFFIHLFQNKKNLIRIWIFYGIGLIIPVGWALYNHSHYNFSKVVSYIIPHPFFNDHTLYASCIAFIFPIVILIGFNPSLFGFNRNTRYIFYFVAALFLFGVIFSFSRAAWLSIIVSGITGLLIVFLRFKVMHFFALILVGLFILSYFGSDIYQNMRSVDDISRKDNVEEHVRSVMNVHTDVSNLERINRWKCALRMFKDRPINGFGPGTYQFIYGRYQVTSELTRISTNHGEKGNAHSEYLMYLSETGLPGLLVFLLLIYFTLTKGLNFFFFHPDKQMKWLVFSILLGLISFLIHSLFNSFLDTDKAAVLFYAALASIASIDILHSKNT